MRRFDATTPARTVSNAASEAVGDPAEGGTPATVRPQHGDALQTRSWSLRRMISSGRVMAAAAALGVFALLIVFAIGQRLWKPAAVRQGSTATGPVAPLPRVDDLCGRELPQDRWIDILPCMDVDRDRVSDYWEVRKDGIGCSGASGHPRIAIPVALHGDYDMEVECTRNSGGGLIRILFPVGDANMPQFLFGGDNGTLYGFSDFNGHGLADPENPTARHGDPLVNGKSCKLSISVRLHGNEATIDVLLDGRPLSHCTAAPSVFPAYHFTDAFELVRPVVGVAAGSDATFHSVRVRLAGGRGAIKPRRLTEACPLGQWIDLLPRIDIARDRLSGDFSRDRAGLTLRQGAKNSVLMFPAAMRGSYELEIEFAQAPALGMISFIVPVGPRRVRVNPTIPGDLHPDPASINWPQVNRGDGEESAPPDELKAGVRHTLSLVVHAENSLAAIDVRIDGKRWLSWSGPLTDLHEGPITLGESDRIGMLASGATTLHSARLRVTSGTGRLVLSESPQP
jgi:hypothetical protein